MTSKTWSAKTISGQPMIGKQGEVNSYARLYPIEVVKGWRDAGLTRQEIVERNPDLTPYRVSQLETHFELGPRRVPIQSLFRSVPMDVESRLNTLEMSVRQMERNFEFLANSLPERILALVGPDLATLAEIKSELNKHRLSGGMFHR